MVIIHLSITLSVFNTIFTLILISFYDRAPQYPTDHRIAVFKEVRRKGNQAILSDPKPSSAHAKGKLWKKITAHINQVYKCFL